MGMLRRISTGAAALGVAVGTTVAGGTPAEADTVSVRYGCSGWGVPGHQTNLLVTITAPATAARGQTVTIRASVAWTGPSTRAYEPGEIRGDTEIKLGGASTGTVKATGLVNPRIEVGSPWRLEGGQGQVTLDNAGTVTYTPDVLRVISHHMICLVVGTAPVAATTRVS